MRLKDFLLLLIRLLLGFIFFSSGMSKLAGGNFGELIGPAKLLEILVQYDLVGFGYLIAVSQIVAGALILTQRYSLIGLITLLPMNVSILTFTVSQGWPGTPYINAFFLLLNILALLYEFRTWKIFFTGDIQSVKVSKTIELFPNKLLPLGILMLTFIAMIVSEGGGLLLNSIASVILILVGINLFQRDQFLKIEKAVLVFYCLTTLTVVYLKFLNNFFSNSLIVVAGLVAVGLLLLLISLGVRIFRSQPRFSPET